MTIVIVCVCLHAYKYACYRFSSARVISDDIVVSHPAPPSVSNRKRQLQEHTHTQGQYKGTHACSYVLITESLSSI